MPPCNFPFFCNSCVFQSSPCMVRKQDKPLPAPPPPLRDPPPPPPERPPPLLPESRAARHLHQAEGLPAREQPVPLEAWCPRDVFGTSQLAGCRGGGDASPKAGLTAVANVNGRHGRVSSEQGFIRKHRRHELPAESAKVFPVSPEFTPCCSIVLHWLTHCLYWPVLVCGF